MDIEWAVEDGKIYILQARPITTLNIRTENTELAMLTSERSKKSYHYIHKRFRTPLYTHILRDAIRAYHNKDIPIDYACDVIYLNQDIATDSDQWNAHKKQWVQYFIENPKSINTLYDETYKTQEQIENYYESLLPQYHDMSKEDLMIFWKQYHTMMQKMLSTVLIPLYIEEWLETKIREYLEQKYPQEKVDYYYQMATTSQKV